MCASNILSDKTFQARDKLNRTANMPLPAALLVIASWKYPDKHKLNCQNA